MCSVRSWLGAYRADDVRFSTVFDASRLGALLGVASVLIVVPGPGVLFIIGRGVRLGRRAAMATVVGHDLGLLVQAFLVAAGVGTIVQRSITVFTVIKLAGAAYLVWLGVQAIRTRREPTVHSGDEPGRSGRNRHLRQGFVVGFTNPKGFLLFASVLPQFVDPSAGPVFSQMAILGMACVGVALVSDSTWALLAGTAQRWFARSPRRFAAVGLVGGTITIGLGVRLALLRPTD
jgi:threonine/homoserine/homoserine lactone efflux protein